MDLENFLKRNKLWYKFLDKPETVHTADAAKATGIELHRVTKNLVSTTNTGEHVLLILPGDRKVDLKAAAQALNVQNIRLIPFDQAEGISGYPPGGTPSIGHKSKMRTIVDESILQYETVYCGGGSRERMLELKSSDITRLNNAIIAKIAIQ